MGMIAAGVVAGGLISGVGKMIGGRKAAEGQIKATTRLIHALKKVEKIDPAKLKEMAISGDKEAYVRRLDFAREADPDLAAIRDQSLSRLSKELGDDGTLGDLYRKMGGMSKAMDANQPARDKLEQTFLERAQEQLDLRSQLDPALQSELVRSGLQTGATSGIGADKRGPLAAMIGKSIAGKQMEVERIRQQNAMAMAQAADTLQSNRQNILAGLTNQMAGLGNMTSGGIGLFESIMPAIGTGGADEVLLDESRRSEKNKIDMEMARLLGQRDMQKAGKKAQTWESGMGMAGNVVSSIAGGGGGGGGLLGGLLGGEGGLIGGLLGGAKTGFSKIFGSGVVPSSSPGMSGDYLKYLNQTGRMPWE